MILEGVSTVESLCEGSLQWLWRSIFHVVRWDSSWMSAGRCCLIWGFHTGSSSRLKSTWLVGIWVSGLYCWSKTHFSCFQLTNIFNLYTQVHILSLNSCCWGSHLPHNYSTYLVLSEFDVIFKCDFEPMTCHSKVFKQAKVKIAVEYYMQLLQWTC